MTYEELKKEMELYPETMTDGERMQKYAAGEEVDHIPFSIQSNEEAMANIPTFSDILLLSGEMTSRYISMS